jgi:hypothetical protein
MYIITRTVNRIYIMIRYQIYRVHMCVEYQVEIEVITDH